METYILKSSAILLTFLVFYKIWLEAENMHFFKRYYLLFSIVCAFGIPLIVLENQVMLPENSFQISATGGSSSILPNVSFSISHALILIYMIGVLVMLIRFVKHLAAIRKRIVNNEKLFSDGISKILHDENLLPHTFLHYIFLNRFHFLDGQISHNVILHEETHARQFHSVDILVVEFLQIIFWFNPLIYLLKSSIRLNHEFLADAGALAHTDHTSYQESLLDCSRMSLGPALTAQFDYASIKKRLLAMKKETNYRSKQMKALFVIPLTCLLFFAFAQRETVLVDSPAQDSIITHQDTIPATAEQVDEYNKLARQFNGNHKFNGNGQLDRLHTLYRAMTVQQRRDAEPFPAMPKAPKPPAPPTPPQPPVLEAPVPPAPPQPPLPVQPSVPPEPPVPPAPPASREVEEDLRQAKIELEEQHEVLQQQKLELEKQVLILEKQERQVELQRKLLVDEKKKLMKEREIQEMEKLKSKEEKKKQ